MNSHWVAMGWMLGYPKCCVEFFASGQHIDAYVANAEFPNLLKGTGFVACPICAATYTDDEMLAIIAHNRKIDIPFGDPRIYYKDTDRSALLLEALYADTAARKKPMASGNSSG